MCREKYKGVVKTMFFQDTLGTCFQDTFSCHIHDDFVKMRRENRTVCREITCRQVVVKV